MTETFQLRRTKGWRKPEDGIGVARPSKWGNPFWVEKFMGGWRVVGPGDWAANTDPYGAELDARVVAVFLFERWLSGAEWWAPPALPGRRRFILDHVHELAGKKLGCWCDQHGPCHAKVLARLADEAVARD